MQCYEAALFCCETNDGEDLRDLRATLHANLAQCCLEQALYSRAEEAASACLALEPVHAKALFRRAIALERLGRPHDALGDLDALLEASLGHQGAAAARKRIVKVLDPTSAAEDYGEWGPPPPVESSSGEAWESSTSRLSFAADNEEPSVLPSSWAEGLSPRQRYEWMVDCYRLRLDDDCAGDSSGLRGLYSLQPRRGTIMEDWMVFCRLVARRSLLPMDWDWCAFLDVAAERLSFKFAEADAALVARGTDALERWRVMAEVVYAQTGVAEIVREEVKRSLRSVDLYLFDAFGGAETWQLLLGRLVDQR